MMAAPFSRVMGAYLCPSSAAPLMQTKTYPSPTRRESQVSPLTSTSAKAAGACPYNFPNFIFTFSLFQKHQSELSSDRKYTVIEVPAATSVPFSTLCL